MIRGELLPALAKGLGHPLHGHVKVRATVWQEAAVHRPEASSPEPPVVGEVLCGGGEVVVAELPGPGLAFLKVVVHGFTAEKLWKSYVLVENRTVQWSGVGEKQQKRKMFDKIVAPADRNTEKKQI
jgi:hypothetical protein